MPDSLRALARSVADRSHVPYSGRPAGVAVLLADGRWTAAPRLENAAFPLTIPALQGALALAALAGGQAVAVAATDPLTPADLAALSGPLGGDWHLEAPDVAVTGDERLLPAEAVSFGTESAGTEGAREAASRAVVPASAFPVGAVLEDTDGRRIWGANVEVATDWTRGLCAERTALVAARAVGLGPVVTVSVACTRAPGGTPCGGCRQVLAELAPDADVVIWHGDRAPETIPTAALLPGAFDGRSLGL